MLNASMGDVSGGIRGWGENNADIMEPTEKMNFDLGLEIQMCGILGSSKILYV